MSDPTTVSPMITDAVQGSSPDCAEHSGNLAYSTLITNANLAMQNAVDQQQAMNQFSLSVTGKAVNLVANLGPDAAAAGEAVENAREAIAQIDETAVGSRTPASAPAGEEQPNAQPVTPHPAIQEFLAMLDRMNAITLRQSIRLVELAAVGAIVARALQVNTAESGAQEQVALWTGLMETVIRDFGAWAESIH